MSFLDFSIAVFSGNALTIWFCAGLWQFHKHDYRAPWWAYGACVIPALVVIATIILTEGLPPHLDALAPRSIAATNP